VEARFGLVASGSLEKKAGRVKKLNTGPPTRLFQKIYFVMVDRVGYWGASGAREVQGFPLSPHAQLFRSACPTNSTGVGD